MPQTFVLPKQVGFVSGAVAPSSVLRFYQTGTSTPQNVYTDAALSNAVTSITADAAGVFAKVYLNPNAAANYRVTLENSAGSVQWTEDDVDRLPASQIAIGAALYPRSTAESAASVTPTNYYHPEGVLARYGAVGDGSTDDATAFSNAALVAAQGVQILGTPGKTYKINSAITCGSVFNLDLRGATIKPGNNTGRITSTAATAAATTTVSSGASLASRSVVVASATSLAVGQTVLISATDFPNFWGEITSIAGTTIELDRTLPATYSGTISFAAYSSLPEQVSISNGVLDGANVTGSAGNSGQALRLLNFRRITLDNLRIINYAPASGANRPVHISDCIDVIVDKVRATDNDIGLSDNILFITGARKAIVSNCIIDGGGFGVNIENSETGIAIANALSGRRKYEDEESVSPARSVRGIKCKSCGYALVQANDIADFETAIKIENYHRFLVTGNTVRNAGLYTYDGQAAIAASSSTLPAEPFGIISDNLIDNVGGNGILIDTSGASTTDANVIVSGNLIRRCGRHAVYCGQQKISAIGNKIEDWNTSNTGSGTSSSAINVLGGINAVGNTFENSDATDCCFNVSFVSGQVYNFRDNCILTANPYFNGGLTIESGAIATLQIASGSTASAATAHNMVRTPNLRECFLEHTNNPTNDPGIIWVSAITSTQITVSCRNDPGSTMNMRVRFIPEMPFTA